MFVTAQGSPFTRLCCALAGGDLLAARTAAGDLPHVDLEEAAVLLVLIAREDPGQARACRAAVTGIARAQGMDRANSLEFAGGRSGVALAFGARTGDAPRSTLLPLEEEP